MSDNTKALTSRPESKLVCVLAARGRPELLTRTLQVTLSNVRHAGTTMVVALDADDAKTIEAARACAKADGRVLVDVQPREDTLGAKYNRPLARSLGASCYLVMVDYAPHVTPGFDQRILEAAGLFPDSIGVVFNHLANASFPGINAMTARWVELCGYLYPPLFPYWFIDHWLDDLARLTDRIAFADVQIDTSQRPGTQELREPGWWGTFFDAGYLERRRIAERLIAALEEPEWRKHLLLGRAPLVEARSQWVNGLLRQNDTQIVQSCGAGAPDGRYARVKAAARKTLAAWADDLERAEREATGGNASL